MLDAARNGSPRSLGGSTLATGSSSIGPPGSPTANAGPDFKAQLLSGAMDDMMERRGIRGLKVKPDKPVRAGSGLYDARAGRRASRRMPTADSEVDIDSPKLRNGAGAMPEGPSAGGGGSSIIGVLQSPLPESAASSARHVGSGGSSLFLGSHRASGETAGPGAKGSPALPRRRSSGESSISVLGSAGRLGTPASAAGRPTGAIGAAGGLGSVGSAGAGLSAAGQGASNRILHGGNGSALGQRELHSHNGSFVHTDVDSDVGDSEADEGDEDEVVGEDWLAHDADEVRREYGDAKLLKEKDLDSQFQRTNALKGLKLRPVGSGAGAGIAGGGGAGGKAKGRRSRTGSRAGGKATPGAKSKAGGSDSAVVTGIGPSDASTSSTPLAGPHGGRGGGSAGRQRSSADGSVIQDVDDDDDDDDDSDIDDGDNDGALQSHDRYLASVLRQCSAQQRAPMLQLTPAHYCRAGSSEYCACVPSSTCRRPRRLPSHRQLLQFIGGGGRPRPAA